VNDTLRGAGSVGQKKVEDGLELEGSAGYSLRSRPRPKIDELLPLKVVMSVPCEQTPRSGVSSFWDDEDDLSVIGSFFGGDEGAVNIDVLHPLGTKTFDDESKTDEDFAPLPVRGEPSLNFVEGRIVLSWW
jgi:hypothetical protein